MHRLNGSKLFIASFGLWALVQCSAAEQQSPDSGGLSIRQQLSKAGAADVSGDFENANSIYLKLTQKHPDSAEAWAAWGEHLRFYAHDGKAAAEAFNKALGAPQKNATASAYAYRGLGELAAKDQHDDAAIEFFKQSLAALPLSDTHRSLCHLYCRQKNFKAAADHARQAVELDPKDPIARLLYAAQLLRAEDRAEGQRQFEKALAEAGVDDEGKAKSPVHCCVYYNAAGFLGVIGKNEAALNMLQRFFETPNHLHLTRAEIESDADFEGLKETTAFKKLLDQYFPKASEATSK